MKCMTCGDTKPENSIKRCDECIRVANKMNVRHWRQSTKERQANKRFSTLMSGWVAP